MSGDETIETIHDITRKTASPIAEINNATPNTSDAR